MSQYTEEKIKEADLRDRVPEAWRSKCSIIITQDGLGMVELHRETLEAIPGEEFADVITDFVVTMSHLRNWQRHDFYASPFSVWVDLIYIPDYQAPESEER